MENIEVRRMKQNNIPEEVGLFLNSICGKYKDKYQARFKDIFEELNDVGIYNRKTIEPYSKIVQQYGSQIFPIVDKKLNIVIITTTRGSHNKIAGLLDAYANKENPELLNDNFMYVYADSFLTSGQGYYLTGASIDAEGGAWLMGDEYVMDNYDKHFLSKEEKKIKRLRGGSLITGTAHI